MLLYIFNPAEEFTSERFKQTMKIDRVIEFLVIV